MLQNCYALYDATTGTFHVGNEKVEKTMRVSGSLLATERITDKQNGAIWQADTLRWQRCPVLGTDETPTTQLTVSQVTDSFCMQPHMKAVLELSGQNGCVWYEYIVFPGIPFVFTQTFVQKYGSVTLQERAVSALAATGNENAMGKTNGEDSFCSTDTLDCIPLGHRQLEVESYELWDKTDLHDTLLDHRKASAYTFGTLEREGNLFQVNDYPNEDALLLVKHAPTPSSALNRRSKDLIVQGNRYACLMGTGIDFNDLPNEKIPYYASAVGAAKTADVMEAFWRYSTAFSAGDPRQSLFVMSNTWGDRSQDMALSEDFLLQEIEHGHRIGVDIVQIDEGWESGITINSLRSKDGVWEGYYSNDSQFWKVNEERFPNGLQPLVDKAKSYGMEIGLWFSPDSSEEFANCEKDIETLFSFYRQYGIRYFKIDGVKIRSKLCEVRFLKILETLTQRSGGDIRFNLDVTAEDRFGYFYQPQYGTLFVENRYTDWGNYYPHNTFKNLWNLSRVLPTRRLQMELLNKNRNPDKYTGMPFAPAEYGMDYLFATVLPANPLVWMEVSHLPEADAEKLSRITAVYKQYAAELFRSRVMPIGEAPNGTHFSGYCCQSPDGTSGHILLFREQTGTQDYTFQLPVSLAAAKLDTLYQSAPVAVSWEDRTIRADFAADRAVIWLRYTKTV